MFSSSSSTMMDTEEEDAAISGTWRASAPSATAASAGAATAARSMFSSQEEEDLVLDIFGNSNDAADRGSSFQQPLAQKNFNRNSSKDEAWLASLTIPGSLVEDDGTIKEDGVCTSSTGNNGWDQKRMSITPFPQTSSNQDFSHRHLRQSVASQHGKQQQQTRLLTTCCSSVDALALHRNFASASSYDCTDDNEGDDTMANETMKMNLVASDPTVSSSSCSRRDNFFEVSDEEAKEKPRANAQHQAADSDAWLLRLAQLRSERQSSAKVARVAKSASVPPPAPQEIAQKKNIFKPNFEIPDADASLDSGPSTPFSFRSNKWQERYRELVEYKKVYGNTCVPNRWMVNYPLAQWVKRQRYQYRLKMEGRNSTLTFERQVALEQLEFVWDLHDAVWEERLNELRHFRQVHGHCKVPTKYPENQELAIWAKCQRRHFKIYCAQMSPSSTKTGASQTPSAMSEDRILKLADAGFVFSNNTSKGAQEILEACISRRRRMENQPHS